MTIVTSLDPWTQLMETVKASEFKAKCLKLMDEVARTGKSLIITKNGRPVAQLVPIERKTGTLFGLHAGLIEICGDIESPIDVGWEAHK